MDGLHKALSNMKGCSLKVRRSNALEVTRCWVGLQKRFLFCIAISHVQGLHAIKLPIEKAASVP